MIEADRKIGDTIAPDAAASAQSTQRLHPATIVLALGKIGPRALNVAPGLLALGVFSDWRIAIFAALAFVGIGLLFDIVGWMRFSYHMGDDDIRIDKGVFERSHSIIPFARIQDVSIEQGPVARILGLAKVKLETGAQGGGAQNDGILDVISLDQAAQLQDAVRSYRQDHAAIVANDHDTATRAGIVADHNRDFTIFAMDMRRLLIAGLFNFSLTLFAVLFALLNQLDDVLPFDVFAPDDWIDLLGRDNPVFSYVDAHRWLVAIVGVTSVAILGVVTGVIRTILRDYGFSLTRSPNGFRRRRGLITRTDVLISLRRIQAIVINSGPIRAAFGWRAVKVQSLGNDETPDNGRVESDHVLAPHANISESAAILSELGVAEAPGDARWALAHPLHHRLLFVPAICACAGIVLGAIFGNQWVWAALPAIILLFAVWIHERCSHGWIYDGRYLYIRHGGLRRNTIIINHANIQSADVVQGPVYRRYNLASVYLGIASSGTTTLHDIHAVPWQDALALRQKLLVRGIV